MELQYVVILGAIVQFFGILSYVKETLKGDTKPNRVTWLMWSVAPMIGSIAAFSDGVRWAALPVFMTGFAPLLVFGASFVNPKAYWKLEKFDYICGGFSVLALILWAVTKEPMVAIVLAVVSDIFASIPTVVKSWKYPETETVHAYTASAFSAVTSFFAIRMSSFSEYAFPIYLVALNLLIIFTIYRKKLTWISVSK